MSRTRHRLLTAGAVSLSALLLGCPQAPPPPVNGQAGGNREASDRSARDRGAREATEAVAAGQLKLKEYPALPSPPGHGEYIRLLKERCGVEYEVPRLPPGVSEADFIQEVRGWNEVMEGEVRKRFGAGILDDLHKEAEKRWKEQARPRPPG